MNHNKNVTKENLIRFYVKERLSSVETAKRLEASHAAIYQALKRYGIPIRDQSAAAHNRHANTWAVDWKLEREKYEGGKTLGEIADDVGCQPASAAKHLRSVGTTIRPKGTRILVDWKELAKQHDQGKTLEEIAKIAGCSTKNVTTRFQKIGRVPEPRADIDAKLVKQMYLDQKFSLDEIAKRVGASRSGIYVSLMSSGVTLRTPSEASSQGRRVNWRPFVERYSRGETVTSIANEVGCAVCTAALHLREAGAKIRRRGSSPARRIVFDLESAIKKNKSGETLTEIARGLKISPTMLYNRFREAGHKTVRHLFPDDEIRRTCRTPVRRAIAQAIGKTCRICGWTPIVQAHIQGSEFGGSDSDVLNFIALCDNHHRGFDNGGFGPAELRKIHSELQKAAEAGFIHYNRDGSQYEERKSA